MTAKNPTLTTLICLPLLAGLFACSGKSDPQEPSVVSSIGGLGQEDSRVGEEFKEAQAEVVRLTGELSTLSTSLEEQKEVIAQKSKLIQKLQNNLDSFNKMIGYGIDVRPYVASNLDFPLVNGAIEMISTDGKVIKINRGKESGVRLGQVFEVVRDEKVIGWLKAGYIDERSSVCGRPGSTRSKASFLVGDQVRTRVRRGPTQEKRR